VLEKTVEANFISFSETGAHNGEMKPAEWTRVTAEAQWAPRGRIVAPVLCLCLLFLCSLTLAQSRKEQIQDALRKTPHPDSAAEFQTVPHLSCLNQGKTSICWSFATSSFVESEMARLKLPTVRLSVAYPVYCAFLEKARRFVRMHGDSRVNAGDLFMGVFNTCRDYGAIPLSVYGGPTPDKPLDHSRLYAEVEKLMREVKAKGEWDENAVVGNMKTILNHHLGEPPQEFSYEGKKYTPRSFVADVVRLPWNEYRMITSFKYAPFNTFTEFKVPDNWQHDTNFFNVPLNEYYAAFKGALQAGYSVSVSIDVSEPSYQTTGKYCLMPESELATEQLTQDAREAGYQSRKTTDDHAVHFIGWKDVGGEDWFLAKDSWKTIWQNKNEGNLLVHSSYVKMKVLAFIVHRDGVPGLQQK
jgi:bleomycin hydrolase